MTAGPTLREHVMKLRVEEHEYGCWIYDNDRPIAFWYVPLRQFDIWQFGPHDEPLAEVGELPRIYDCMTYFNMHAMLRWNIPHLGAEGREGHSPPEQIEQNWLPREDGGMCMELLGRYDNGDHTRHTFEISFDADQDKYRFVFSADMYYQDHCAIEYFNFFPRGACHSQRDQQRYTHTVWRGPDEKWHSFPHNTVFTTSISCGLKYLGKSCGQLGFGANPLFNPMLRVLEAVPGLVTMTCSQLRDEHFIIQPGSISEREDGFYHTKASLELVNLPESEMRRIMSLAEPVSLTAADQERHAYPPFTVGEVCDFEEAIPVDQPGYQTQWLSPGENEQNFVTWVDGKGHSGRRCLGVDAIPAVSRGYSRAFPIGATPQPGVGQRCRLTAWVDTTELRGQAWIALARMEYSPKNVTLRACSPRLSGGHDWTELSVELDTGDQELLLPELFVKGEGTAFFDDVLMEKV